MGYDGMGWDVMGCDVPTDPQVEDVGMSRQQLGSFLHPELGPVVRLRFPAQKLRQLQNQI